MLKGIFDKLFNSNQKTTHSEVKPISQAEVEALVDARIKEHAAAVQSTSTDQMSRNQANDQDDYSLTAKQIEYAFTLIGKLNGEYELAIEPTQLKVKDLNRFIAYNRYKNKGILVNLVKKGVLRKK